MSKEKPMTDRKNTSEKKTHYLIEKSLIEDKYFWLYMRYGQSSPRSPTVYNVDGRAAAKARGKSGGRPRTDPDKLEQARILYINSDKSARKVCELFGFSRRTLFSYMKITQKPLT